ncbi:hypothetical protein FRC01_007141 [Tulasnella sp. 417]|nr:hypothetical protein FRC01_007141 [Tulasnella sp. 417]
MSASSRPSTANRQQSTSSDEEHSQHSSQHSNSPPPTFDDDDEVIQPQRPSGTLRVLARGNACLCCRRRKLVKMRRNQAALWTPPPPACSRGRRTNECVYEEAKVKTKTQVLQSRIRELEAKMKRMAERERQIITTSGSPPITPPTTGSSSSKRRTTLPSAVQPAQPLHSNSVPMLAVPPRSDSADSFSFNISSTSSGAFDPLSGLGSSSAWTSQTDLSSFGQSELLQNVAATLDARPHSSSNASWTSATSGLSSTAPNGNWLDILPQADPTPMFPVDPIASYSSAAPMDVTITPAALTPNSFIPRPTMASNFSPSPSLSTAVSTGHSSSVSSPPSTSWEDDVRFSTLDLTRTGDVDDVPPEISRQLLNIFMQHRRQCMFEVHPDRFLQAVNSPDPSQRPHPALVNAIYLLGCHFAPKSTVSQYENIFLARTRKGINASLENADRLLNFLQASCLLAWYFFFKGRLLEGHYHASAAARFAMSCGLHLLKVKADGVQGTLTFYYPSPGNGDRSILPQPEDSIALAERINLFWSIFQADRTGSIGTGLPVVIRDEEIETPWPRRFEDFELDDLVRFDSNTLRSLYVSGNAGAYIKASDNLHSIKSKALALNERASRLASILESDPGAVSDPDFWPQFDSIDSAISRFVESLPAIRAPAVDDTPTNQWAWEDEEVLTRTGQKSQVSPSLIFAYTAAYGAVIQLHRMFSQNDAGSYRRCLSAARAAMSVASEAQAVDPTYLPMMLGIIWTTVAEALAVEHERQRRLANEAQKMAVEAELTTLFVLMKELRAVFPILTLRINKVPIFQGCSLELDGSVATTYAKQQQSIYSS